MLQKLVIKNYAIIDNLVFEPDISLNTITGETGAGKSIIMGALSLIMGERADSSVLINKNDKLVVEGYFDVSNNTSFKKALDEAELDVEDQCIIRREIAITGKSRAFINDTPVNLSLLNSLVALLVDMHRQFGHLALEDDSFPIEILDSVGNANAIADNYRKLFQRYKKLNQQLNEAKEKRAQWQKEADYKQYLFDELKEAAFKENEIENAEQQLKQISNSERIKNILQSGRAVLNEGEIQVVNELKQIAKQLAGIIDVMPAAKPIQERITSVYEELKDISSELEILEEQLNFDPEQMEYLQQRVDLGYKLLKKHSAGTTAELISIREHLESEISTTIVINESIEQLAKEETKIYKELLEDGKKLSVLRKKATPIFTEKINKLLSLVGMPNASFKTETLQIEPNINGIDSIQFMFDANKSGQYQLLQKAASGGEMSRIMLCIKSLTATALHLPTLIFDEVDAGISGEAARQVAILLQDLAKSHQIICITHQPQVAAKGTRHYYVYKEPEKSGRLTTKIKILEPSERIIAIARMIGGEKPSEAAINNAKELVSQ